MAWFKNLILYRLSHSALSAETLTENLEPRRFAPCTDLQPSSAGFLPLFDDAGLVYSIPGGHMLMAFCTEKKSIPKQAIDRLTREKCRELEEQQGFRPGRKQTKEIREAVVDELLPRALTTRATTRVWLDLVGGWLGIEASSQARADEVIRVLLRAMPHFPLDQWRPAQSPVAAMTTWIANDWTPANFTIDQDAELRGVGVGKATVRYVRHSLDGADVAHHIVAGKQCTRLAMTWSDKVSLVLNEDGAVKRIAPLDVLTESLHMTENDADRRDTDLALMCGEFRAMLADLTAALGGFAPLDAAA